jgi:copper chaperone CopZ
MKQKITLHPSRIGCPSIPGTMKGIVASIKGVEEVKVRYAERSLDIVFHDETTTPDVIIKIIGDEMGLAMEVADHGSSKRENVEESCPM